MTGFQTLGTDTELLARRKDGQHVALCGKIGGSKHKPLQMKDFPQGFALQEDNVAVEFNIPPAVSKTVWSSQIQRALEETKRVLDGLGLTISEEVSVSFDQSELTHPDAIRFGCDPDFNAWTKMENASPTCSDRTLRTVGGHIHVGAPHNMIEGVKMMDLYLGVPSVLLDSSAASSKRRELYGKAGAMRPKGYGWEYRVLSNYWVFNKTLINWIYDNTSKALNQLVTLPSRESERIIKCINEADKELAKIIVNDWNIPMPRGFTQLAK